MWRAGRERFGRQDVEKMGCFLQCFNLEAGEERSLEQKGAHNVISGTDDALSLTILGGGVGA